jgi:hypothetical protein
MQISQFIIGGSGAMVHAFISYLVPVETDLPVADAAATIGVVNGIKQALNETMTPHVTKYHKLNCLDTTGQNFGVWLNVIYLAPLTYLFVSFFITSYLRRSKAENIRGKAGADRRHSNVTLAEKASWDAARGLEREVYGESNEGAIIEESDESTGADKF